MNSHRARLRPLCIPERKNADFEQPSSLKGGHLSPDLQPNTPPSFPDDGGSSDISQVGQYLLLERLDSIGSVHVHKALNCDTREQLICKVIPIEKYRGTLAGYWQVDGHENINQIEEILLGETQAYVFFACNYGDLHSYVRNKRKLIESEAIQLFHQIVTAVGHCHENGVVLRDLKLRKFVFKDEDKSELKLEGLEDAYVLDDEEDDVLADKHGCPAYVSPEILNTRDGYSGKAADIWSLGVMLYTMLIGRYPFHDVEPSALFTKIRRGQYHVPDTISSKAKCLIRSLLRRVPGERLTAEEVLQHPWFNAATVPVKHSKGDKKEMDQIVPDVRLSNDESFFF